MAAEGPPTLVPPDDEASSVRTVRRWGRRLLAGVLALLGAAWAASGRRRRLDPRIVRALPRSGDPPLVVFVPGLMGSQLLRPDGSEAWLNLGNTLGHHDLSLPRRLPLPRSRPPGAYESVPGCTPPRRR